MLRAIDTSEPDPSDRSLPALKPRASTIRPRNMLRIGEWVAGCEVRRTIGQGGMGQVYEAFDPILARVVALKATWTDLGGPALAREGRALAAIPLPCVPRIHHFLEHEGVSILVMERIRGRPLDDHLADLASRGLVESMGEGLALLEAIAQALAVVHRAGIVHRDVKPANVMLAPAGRIVLMDFGISSIRCEEAFRIETSGSPAYMAPETIASTSAPGVGHLVDIYAFGVVAFEVLTGRVPFAASSVAEVFHSHLSAEVPDPRRRRPEIPEALAELMCEMLAKEPGERPVDIEDVALRLRAVRKSLAA
jgi:serine/threonine-protein kinase